LLVHLAAYSLLHAFRRQTVVLSALDERVLKVNRFCFAISGFCIKMGGTQNTLNLK